MLLLILSLFACDTADDNKSPNTPGEADADTDADTDTDTDSDADTDADADTDTEPPPPDPTTRFAADGTRWTIPSPDEYSWKVYDYYSRHAIVDMDGDGMPDFVDSENEDTTSVSDTWVDGGQESWRVYRNNGSGFGVDPVVWKVPSSGEYSWKIDDYYSRHAILDMNGDGMPDFVDSENEYTASVSDTWIDGEQESWRVYLNNGSGFDADPIVWDVPSSDEYSWKVYDYYSRHAIMDINGDGLPDLVDSENEDTTSVSDTWVNNAGQESWRVYLNNGSGFDADPIVWKVPSSGEYSWKINDYYSRHTIMDVDGDGLLDFIDSENEDTASVSDTWIDGEQESWRVYLNNGSGFDADPIVWDVPSSDEYSWKVYDYYSRHAIMDINGDGLLDFVDSEDEATSSVSDTWVDGGQESWRVYIGTGSGFSRSAVTWDVPSSGEYSWKIDDYYSRHGLRDIDGDGALDFLDTENEGTESVSDTWVSNSGQESWRVYFGE